MKDTFEMIPIVLDTCGVLTLKTSVKTIENLSKTTAIYITPTCLEELKGFIDITPKILAKLHVKSPNREDVKINGAVVWEMVCEFRKRSDESIKYASSIVREAYNQVPQGQKKKEPEPCTPLINRLREGMRHHTREGYIDSGTDVDTLFLALELKAKLCTVDKGLLKWANRFGIELALPESLEENEK